MGKKRKYDILVSGSSSVASGRRIINLNDMPANHVRKFYLNNENLGSQVDYLLLLGWLRDMCAAEGTVFDGIPNPNCCNGFPLIQVEVIHGNTCNKLLFSKMDLYLIAYVYKEQWHVFDGTDFEIVGAIQLQKKVNYESKPWMEMGAKPLLAAMNLLTHTDQELRKSGCEIFMVHFSEAARFFPLQHLIYGTLIPDVNSNEAFDLPLEYQELVDLTDNNGNILNDALDVFNLVKVVNSVNFCTSSTNSSYIEDLLKNWKNLSKIWYVYALTDRQIFHILPAHMKKFGIKNRRSLRSVLGLVCNINLDTLVNDWKKKVGNVANFTGGMYKTMEQRVKKLRTDRQVR